MLHWQYIGSSMLNFGHFSYVESSCAEVLLLCEISFETAPAATALCMRAPLPAIITRELDPSLSCLDIEAMFFLKRYLVIFVEQMLIYDKSELFLGREAWETGAAKQKVLIFWG